MSESDSETIALVASIWQQDGKYLPAIHCKLEPSGADWITTVRVPLKPWKLPINAARTAQNDLMKATAELERPRTQLDTFLFLYKIGYRIVMILWIDEVVAAERVLRHEAMIDGLIKEFRPEVVARIVAGDPPFMKETLERLIREGVSAEKATDLITRAFAVEFFKQDRKKPGHAVLKEALSRLPRFPFDTPYLNPSFRKEFEERLAQGPPDDEEEDLPYHHEKEEFPSGSVNYAMQLLRRREEGISDTTILELNPLEQLVLEAIEELMLSRLRYVEGIAAMAGLLAADDISAVSVFETLTSLEARYAVFTWFPDPLEYPDLAGKQYFRMTDIGERSLRKVQGIQKDGDSR